MKVEVNKKSYNIPDDTIANYMKKLDLTEQEAIEMWLSDRDIIENEEVEELTEKAKKNGTAKIVVQSKVDKAKTTRKPKENPLKTRIIQYLFDYLSQNKSLQALKIENPTKTINFIAEGKEFSLNLVEHRPKKK